LTFYTDYATIVFMTTRKDSDPTPKKRNHNAVLPASVALATVILVGYGVKIVDTRDTNPAPSSTPNSRISRSLTPEETARRPLNAATASAAMVLIAKAQQAHDYQPTTTKASDGATVFSWNPIDGTQKPVITLTYRSTSLEFQAKPADVNATDSINTTWNLVNPLDEKLVNPTADQATGPLRGTDGHSADAVDITNLEVKYQKQLTTGMFVTPDAPLTGKKFDITNDGIPADLLANPALNIVSELMITDGTADTLNAVSQNTELTLNPATTALYKRIS
jgi:hypothetical protein